MRILLACAAFPPHGRGGGPIASELLAKTLAPVVDDLRVVVVGDHAARTRQNGYEVVTLRSFNVYHDWLQPHSTAKKLAWHALENFNPRAYFAMHREILDYQPDVVVTVSVENINVATWAAAHAAGVTCAHVAQSYFLMCWRGSLFKDGQNCSRCASCKLLSVGKRLLSRHVDLLITETAFVQQQHVTTGFFPNAAFRVIPGPIDTPLMQKRSPPPTLRVGFIGTHTRNKGIETLAEAAVLVSGRNDIHFVIAGDGEPDYTAELKARFPQEMTSFVGWVKSEDFYNSVDVLVVPSVWREPFGRVSIEGTSFGLPVLASRSGGLVENVSDGVDGFLFEPRDAKALAQRLIQIATDHVLYEQLSDGALARAARHAPSRIADDLLKSLEEAVAKKRSRQSRPEELEAS